jgi:glycosyltransferase involved in cell wall biosynthesis
MNGIALAYSGAHQIFQLALAAHELDELEQIWCTVVDFPGSWGRRLSRFASIPSARPLGYQDIPCEKIKEYPWPVVVQRGVRKLFRSWRSEHYHTNGWFDSMMAKRLMKSSAKLFVGAETCAMASLKAAKERGMKTLLDVAGISNEFLAGETEKAEANFGLRASASRNSPAMQYRKSQELALADHILCCSDFQARVLMSEGTPAEKITVIPLWVDHAYWTLANQMRKPKSGGSLKVLYAGTISLRKGVPYLVEAVKSLGDDASFTMVGSLSPEMIPWLPANARFRPYQSQGELRALYAEHDVLVMPSLGDSFGFVALEAMAAGLPVIATEHCGVPMPDPYWRVPAHNSSAIARRLRHYLMHRGQVQEDGALATAFASAFTTISYRDQVRKLFLELLA